MLKLIVERAESVYEVVPVESCVQARLGGWLASVRLAVACAVWADAQAISRLDGWAVWVDAHFVSWAAASTS
jgi:hypothetical protein